MSSHIGHDHTSGFRFHITEIHPETNTVAIQYDETAWSSGEALEESLPWREFIEQLVHGRFEIRRVD